MKPTTGGGIYYGLLSGAIAAEVLGDALRRDRLAATSLRRYETLWRRRLGQEIRVGLAFRRIAARLSDEIDRRADRPRPRQRHRAAAAGERVVQLASQGRDRAARPSVVPADRLQVVGPESTRAARSERATLSGGHRIDNSPAPLRDRPRSGGGAIGQESAGRAGARRRRHRRDAGRPGSDRLRAEAEHEGVVPLVAERLASSARRAGIPQGGCSRRPPNGKRPPICFARSSCCALVAALAEAGTGALIMKGAQLAYSHYATTGSAAADGYRPPRGTAMDARQRITAWSTSATQPVEQVAGDLVMYQVLYVKRRDGVRCMPSICTGGSRIRSGSAAC